MLQVLILACGGGCNKPAPGPKREDHKAAHTPRYHPHVDRSASSAPAAPVETDSDVDGLAISAGMEFPAAGSGRPILFVNGQALTVQEVLEPIIEDLKQKAASYGLPAYRNHALREVRNQIDFQISMIVIYEEAKARFSEERMQEAFDKEADRMVKDVVNRRFGGVHARYEAHLKTFDLTMEDMKARAKRQAMVMQFLHDRFRPMITEPTRRELVRYYENNPDEFTTPAKAEMFLIEVPLAAELGKPVTEATAVERAAACERARAHLSRAIEELASGVEFEAIAKKYCKGVRGRTGGAWGEISPGSLTGRWAKAAEVLFTLGAGQTSEIIETEDALLIVRCGQCTAARTEPFEQAQEQIISRLMDSDFNRRRDAYVQELRGKATIEKYPEFLQAVLAAVPPPAAARAAGPE